MTEWLWLLIRPESQVSHPHLLRNTPKIQRSDLFRQLRFFTRRPLQPSAKGELTTMGGWFKSPTEAWILYIVEGFRWNILFNIPRVIIGCCETWVRSVEQLQFLANGLESQHGLIFGVTFDVGKRVSFSHFVGSTARVYIIKALLEGLRWIFLRNFVPRFIADYSSWVIIRVASPLYICFHLFLLEGEYRGLRPYAINNRAKLRQSRYRNASIGKDMSLTYARRKRVNWRLFCMRLDQWGKSDIICYIERLYYIRWHLRDTPRWTILAMWPNSRVAHGLALSLVEQKMVVSFRAIS